MQPRHSQPLTEWRCSQCGASGEAPARFCGVCGGELPPPAPPPQAYEWEIDMPLLTNRFLLYDFAKVFAWTALIMIVMLSVIFVFTGDFSAREFAAIVGMTALGIFVVALLAVLVMVVFFGNRYRAAFSIDDRGIGYESRSRRGKWANRAAIAAGILRGRPSVAGAGLIAASQESMGLRWGEIVSVNDHPDARVLSLRNSWRVLLRLHCTPDNYEPVKALIASRLPAGAIRPGPAAGGGDRLRRLLIAAAAYAAASFGAGGLPLPWMAAAAAIVAASAFVRGQARTLLSAAAAVAAALQVAAWPGEVSALLDAGWRAAPVAIGFAAIAALLIESLGAMKNASACLVAALVLAAAPLEAADRAKPPWKGLNFFSEADELGLGRRYAAELDRRLPIIRDSEAAAVVDRIGRRLAAQSPRQAEWRFSVVNTREVNAYAVPGGFIYVNRGLLDLARSDDEIAGVLAHEIAHVAARHGTRALSKQLLLSAIAMGASLAASRKSERWGEVAAVAGGATVLMAQLKYSRNDEYQADALGADIMQRAGYSPHGLAVFFERLRGENARGPSRAARWLALVSTHPPMQERIARLQPVLVSAPPPASFSATEIARAHTALSGMAYPPEPKDQGLTGVLASVAGVGAPAAENVSLANLNWDFAHRFRVPGNTVWLKTGLTVRPGDGIAIQAEGEIWPIRNSDASCGPGGLPGANRGVFKPITRANTGALVANIRPDESSAGKYILVGEGAAWTAATGGMLELGINDDNNFDNRGEFQVQILIRRGGAQ